MDEQQRTIKSFQSPQKRWAKTWDLKMDRSAQLQNDFVGKVPEAGIN